VAISLVSLGLVRDRGANKIRYSRNKKNKRRKTDKSLFFLFLLVLFGLIPGGFSKTPLEINLIQENASLGWNTMLPITIPSKVKEQSLENIVASPSVLFFTLIFIVL